MRKYNNINITEISRDMCYVLTTIKSVLMFRIQARSAEYSRTLIIFNSSFSFEIISPTNTINQVHFPCIPFREMFFSISRLVLATSIRRICLWSGRLYCITLERTHYERTHPNKDWGAPLSSAEAIGIGLHESYMKFRLGSTQNQNKCAHICLYFWHMRRRDCNLALINMHARLLYIHVSRKQIFLSRI
jgi:hypothetical protein